jgi:hypothetical protein
MMRNLFQEVGEEEGGDVIVGKMMETRRTVCDDILAFLYVCCVNGKLLPHAERC